MDSILRLGYDILLSVFKGILWIFMALFDGLGELFSSFGIAEKISELNLFEKLGIDLSVKQIEKILCVVVCIVLFATSGIAAIVFDVIENSSDNSGGGYSYSRKNCMSCSGSGNCGECGGSGKKNEWVGDQYMYLNCTRCGGTGNCPSCYGSGKQ